MRRRNLLGLAIGTVVMSLIGIPALANPTEVASVDGIALDGYDPVSYFRDTGPQRGRAAFSLKWMGVIWRFASAENRDDFEMNPRAYMPMFGGYCAWNAARGRLVPGAPLVWEIRGGKLYLAESPAAMDMWHRDLSKNLAAAEANWPKILNQ